MNRTFCALAALMTYAGTASVAAPAFAQASTTAPAETGGRLEEIVVTARRVTENLQDVPVAVTAMSGQQLQQQNAVRVSDIARLTPGFTIRPASSTATAINLQIRGQFQNDVLATLDPSVGTYVDGYYWARAYGLNSDLLDVQSVQVLRGPQGTLFGRNTTGGALLIQTNDPRLDAFSGMVSASYGRFDERSLTGMVNIPIVQDRVALRLAGTVLKRDGYVDSARYSYNGVSLPTLTSPLAGGADAPAGGVGRKLGGRDNYTIRGKLRANVTDNLTVLLSAEQYRYAAFGQNWRASVVDPNSAANTEAGLELGATPANAAAVGRNFWASYIPFAQSGDHVALNEDPYSFAKTQTYTGTVTLDTDYGVLKYIGGWRRVRSHANIDLDGSPIFLFDTIGRQDLKQYSHELQLTGKAFDNHLDFVTGAFYFKEYGFDTSRSVALPAATLLRPGAFLSTQIYFGDVDTKSTGVYGQATWRFNDRLSFTGGLRYSEEDKGLTSYNRVIATATGALIGCSITGANPASSPFPCQIARSDKFHGVSYTAGLNYKLNDDTLVYAKTSKGFRSGGQNLRAAGTANATFVPFRPEVNREEEVGLKTELLDRRLRLNVAGFYNEVTDIQRSTLVTFINPLTGATGSSTIVGNAGKVRNYGGEAEVTAAITDELTLSANAAYVKPKYLQFTGIDASGRTIDRRRERFEQVPKWTANLNANYERQLDIGKLALSANYAWQDTTPLGVFNYFTDASGVTRDVSGAQPISLSAAMAVFDAQKQKAGGQLNLRAALTVMDNRLELAVWGRNVTNFRPNISSLFFTPATSTLATQKRDPAMYGVTATYRFGQP